MIKGNKKKQSAAQQPSQQSQKKNPSARAERRKRQRARKANMKASSSIFSTSGSVVPRNEQDRMRQTVMSGESELAKKYLATLIYPKMNEYRIPDSFARPSSVITSIATFMIPVSSLNAADPDTGRFSVAVQPHMGSLARPASYKIAIAKPPAGLWSQVDWADPLAYIDSVDGIDPRIDQFYLNATQPPLGSYFLKTQYSVGTPFEVGANAPYEDANDQCVRYNTAGTQMVFGSPSGRNWFRLSPGQYIIAFAAETTAFAATFTADPSVSLHLGQASDLIIDSVTAYRSGDQFVCAYSALLTVKGGVTINVIAPISNYAVNYANTWLTITPTFYTRAADEGTLGGSTISTNSYPSGKFGMIQEYRTVGCSALATYMGPELTNGGTIAGSYLLGDSLETGFFTTSPSASVGQLQNHESLARTKGAMSGRLEEGVYIWWSPEDMNENMFRSPDYFNNPNDPTPSLVISGVYSPNAAITSSRVIRLEVVTVYEVQTISQMLKSEVVAGSQAILDSVNRSLACQPHVMPNASHMSWLSDFWGGVKQGLGYVAAPAKILYDNRNSILPIVSTML